MNTSVRTLTPEEIETYRRDGVVCLRGVLNDEWVAVVKDAVDDAERRYTESATADLQREWRSRHSSTRTFTQWVSSATCSNSRAWTCSATANPMARVDSSSWSTTPCSITRPYSVSRLTVPSLSWPHNCSASNKVNFLVRPDLHQTTGRKHANGIPPGLGLLPCRR